MFFFFTDRPRTGCDNGETRLIFAELFTEGVVEVCVNNVWRPLCNDNLQDSDATVICNSMGFGGGKSGDGEINLTVFDVQYYNMDRSFVEEAFFTGHLNPTAIPQGQPVILSPNCTGIESSIEECDLDSFVVDSGSGDSGVVNCSAQSGFAFIVCQRMLSK